jgi:hypothetical protein
LCGGHHPPLADGHTRDRKQCRMSLHA